jgi:hypothetical protein
MTCYKTEPSFCQGAPHDKQKRNSLDYSQNLVPEVLNAKTYWLPDHLLQSNCDFDINLRNEKHEWTLYCITF